MGPLQGFKIIEIAGIGPGQLCGMLLADMGAQVLRVDRIQTDDLGIAFPARFNLMNRSRPTIAIDLKHPEAVDLILDLCRDADALFEGYRPGVMERMGLGPSACLGANPRLVYGRMTGWGQDGPLADSVGHDTNFIALSGALAAIGKPDEPPQLPLNLVGDFGGGALYLAMGLLAALLETSRSGQGQVVDAAMIDGVASMMTLMHGLHAGGMWSEQRESNFFDGGAPYARAYRTADGKDIAICAIENRFYRALLQLLEAEDIDPARQHDRNDWPRVHERLEAIFASRSQAHWCDLLEGTDGCFAPVLTITEAPNHPHHAARGTYVNCDGIVQPAPAPRFSRTVSSISQPPEEPGTRNEEVLASWGVTRDKIEELTANGVLGVRSG